MAEKVRADDEDRDHHPPHGDAGGPGRRVVAAGGIDPAAQDGVVEQEMGDHDRDGDRSTRVLGMTPKSAALADLR